WQLAVGSRQLAVGSRQSVVGSWQLAVSKNLSECEAPDSVFEKEAIGNFSINICKKIFNQREICFPCWYSSSDQCIS
ncbi:MAG: hypothetical protein HY738_05870, partial [Bacteroidia bacterium]|nr:hypothetical protein [Bacteroidia bacterium]